MAYWKFCLQVTFCEDMVHNPRAQTFERINYTIIKDILFGWEYVVDITI